MGFTLDIGSHPIMDEEISEEHSEEILLFGRALEFHDVDPVSQHQLSLPLFNSNEPVAFH